MSGPICPKCNQPAREQHTHFGTRHECCGLWSWGGKALVDRRTHDARKRAHAALDPVWQVGVLSRAQVYARLAEKMGLSGEECHMSRMTAVQAESVPGHVIAILDDLTAAQAEKETYHAF